MTFLPIGLNVTGKRILIIGGGRVGLHKATILHRFVSEAVVISPKFNEGFDELPFARIQKEYEPADLDGAFLVYICTENEALNRQIKYDAEARGILASVCDNPEICDFISPAIYKEGNLTVSVLSNATDVRQSIAIRNNIRDNIDLLKNRK
ncbi:MAG: bifunctional precorrin-2 dehydrogenase/sirohydrochlorin ferrochelatase [Bacteroidaceae bacterium]|nr:bifunctional precorrin-2 dehydrogenase/sirohydrochlorin ferrochelatase [Bacteroidaceae bacterium]